MIRLLFLIALGGSAAADTLVAAHTIRAKTVLGPEDIAILPGNNSIGQVNVDAVLGLEARVTLYAGRPIHASDLGPPAVIERNQMVKLVYDNGVVSISTDGRALERAGVGDPLRAMNSTSRTTVVGLATSDGRVLIQGEK